MDITGTVIRIGHAVQVSEKFRKRTFVIKEDSSKYPQTLEFQCTQDRCDLIDKLHTGAIVKVHFNLRGREWTDNQGQVKVFNTLEAWKLDVEGQANHESAVGNVSSNAPSDDLPF